MTEVVENFDDQNNGLNITRLIDSTEATEDEQELQKLISRLCLHVYTGGIVPQTKLGSYKTESHHFAGINNASKDLVANTYMFDELGLCIVACRGSESWLDWYSNFTKWGGKGTDDIPEFIVKTTVSIYGHLMKVKTSRTTRFIFTGHSRGGAIASYLGYVFKTKNMNANVKIITYACPAYAKKEFADKFNNLFKNDAINKYTPLDPIQLLSLLNFTPGRSVYTTYQYAVDINLFSRKIQIPGIVLGVIGDLGLKILFSIRNLFNNLGSVLYKTLHTYEEFKKYNKMNVLEIILNLPEVFICIVNLSFSQKIVIGLICSFIYEVFGFENQHSMETYSYHECGIFNTMKELLEKFFKDLVAVGRDCFDFFWNFLSQILQFLQKQCKNFYEFLKSKAKPITVSIERFMSIFKALNSCNFV